MFSIETQRMKYLSRINLLNQRNPTVNYKLVRKLERKLRSLDKTL